MTSKYAALALALFPALACAQNTAPDPPAPETTKVIHVRYARAEAIAAVLNSRSVFANNGLKAIVVQGNPSFIAGIEQAVKELDVPASFEQSRDVELTIYVIGASAGPAPQSAPGMSEIEPVLRQLRAVFPYGGYQLLDSMIIRSREGRGAHSEGLIRNFPDPRNAFINRYNIECTLEPRQTDTPERTIRFLKFVFGTGVPGSEVRVSIDTALDVQDGQKVVVGNTNIDGGNSALFVVLSARFVP